MPRRSPSLGCLVACIALIFGPALVRAEDDPWASVDDAVKKRGQGSPILVLVGRADGAEVKAARTALADKRVAKLVQSGLTVTRIDPSDDDAAKKVGVTTEKAECLVVLDGYGIQAGKHDKSLTTDSLVRLVKQAEEVTAKKKKTEKTLEAGVSRGEAALKKDDTKTACELFTAVMEYATSVPCASTEKAKKHLGALTEKGLAALTKARTALAKSDFAGANKLVGEAVSSFPTAEVIAEGKKVHDEIAAAEVAQQQQR